MQPPRVLLDEPVLKRGGSTKFRRVRGRDFAYHPPVVVCVDARGHVIRDGQFEGGGAAGLEFVAADVVLVGSLDASRRALVVAGDGGALEAEDGLYVDADAAASSSVDHRAPD